MEEKAKGKRGKHIDKKEEEYIKKRQTFERKKRYTQKKKDNRGRRVNEILNE